MKNRAAVFDGWAKSPGTSEAQRCANAESVVRNAIGASADLSGRDIRIFSQGSYRNKTNVRADSDVDICVCCTDTFFYDLTSGATVEGVGIREAQYEYSEFKDAIEAALKDYLGAGSVRRGNKAIDVRATSYHVDLDVVAAFEYRRYVSNSVDGFISGTELRPDSGGRIQNWPQQHYENGVSKTKATSYRFKKVVRILKSLRNQMADDRVGAAEVVPSYLLECLCWNVPDRLFGADSLEVIVEAALVHLHESIVDVQTCDEWGEVNELKYLFRASQPWTVDQARAFVAAAWRYAGYGA